MPKPTGAVPKHAGGKVADVGGAELNAGEMLVCLYDVDITIFCIML